MCRHCTAFKLVDVPELGYTTQDKPYPRGELRVKTKLMIPGYFKHPKVLCPALKLGQHTGGPVAVTWLVCRQSAVVAEMHDPRRVKNIIKHEVELFCYSASGALCCSPFCQA